MSPPDTSAESLRARKARRTREAIVAAAIALFDAHGYDAVSVAQIAERAEVGSRTFFRYFADKEEVLFGEDDTVELLRAELGAADTPAPVAMVRAARAVLDHLAGRAELVPARERIIAATPALQARALQKHHRYRTTAQEELVQRHGLSPTRAAVLGQVVFGCALAAYEAWSRDPGSGAPGDHLDAALRQAADDLVALREG